MGIQMPVLRLFFETNYSQPYRNMLKYLKRKGDGRHRKGG